MGSNELNIRIATFAQAVSSGRMTIDQVPLPLQEAVREIAGDSL
jgi:hypothetical protein